MNSKILLEQTAELWNELQYKIRSLNRTDYNDLVQAQYGLAETDEVIRKLKSWVLEHRFDCWESEILFFRELKPKFIARFIYYSRIVSLLSSLPMSGSKYKKKMYEAEFETLQQFSRENSAFISYYRRKASYLDLKYFVRFRYDLDVKLATDIHSYDDRFSTSHDHLIAHILANDDYEAFLKQQIRNLELASEGERAKVTGLQWTASKAALTELVYALHHTRCFNGGSATLAETVKFFEEHFSVNLGNYHNTMGEIKNRKIDRTKFLHQLSENLKDYLDAADEMR